MTRILDVVFSLAALVLPTVASGMSIFILKGFFDALPRELYEAAEVDGANKWRQFWKITLPVAISASGVVAEVLRSGVQSVPKGQWEAAMSLGMSWRSMFFKVIFPQAFRYVIPALISEIVIVLKDTTFAYVVNYADLMQNARVLISNYDALLSVYLVVAAIYILINYVLNKISVAAAAGRKGKR